MKINIVSIVGARPQFVKLAPIARAMANHPTLSHSVINTGQHYDDAMSKVFFDELQLPVPDIDLEVGSGNHGMQTGRMMEKLESCFLEKRPDVVVVYGDTNSTLAASLVAAKLHIRSAHIEAGLRSFNRQMPEEINRITADHCSDRLYPPTQTGMRNLEDENLANRSLITGDIMRDAVIYNYALAKERSQAVKTHGLTDSRFGLLTLHRPVNTTPEELDRILSFLGRDTADLETIVFPVHPRTRAVLEQHQISVSDSIRLIEPLSYLDMLSMVKKAAIVLTDSGGLQKEAAFLDTPCITLREETEWTETLDLGVNILTGTTEENVQKAMHDTLTNENIFDDAVREGLDQHFGLGNAAEIIVEDLCKQFAR